MCKRAMKRDSVSQIDRILVPNHGIEKRELHGLWTLLVMSLLICQWTTAAQADLEEQRVELSESPKYIEAHTILTKSQSLLTPTQAIEAIDSIIDELTQAKTRHGGSLLPEFQKALDYYQQLSDFCTTKEMNCFDLFGKMYSIKEMHMLDYLNHCAKVQAKRCPQEKNLWNGMLVAMIQASPSTRNSALDAPIRRPPRKSKDEKNREKQAKGFLLGMLFGAAA